MNIETHCICFDGAVLQRGFWLYVWEITMPDEAKVYYVGRTGDSSSTSAQSPFNRMSQHLGALKNNNMLRGHLESRHGDLERCHFRLVAHGPVEAESKNDRDAHVQRRDRVAAMEKELADAMDQAGYELINKVTCRKVIDPNAFAVVLAAFAERFPKLRSPSRNGDPPASAPDDGPAR